MMNLRLIHVFSSVAFAVAAVLWVMEVISQPVFITLVVLGAALSMGLSIWLLQSERSAARNQGALQDRIDAEEISQPD